MWQRLRASVCACVHQVETTLNQAVFRVVATGLAILCGWALMREPGPANDGVLVVAVVVSLRPGGWGPLHRLVDAGLPTRPFAGLWPGRGVRTDGHPTAHAKKEG